MRMINCHFKLPHLAKVTNSLDFLDKFLGTTKPVLQNVFGVTLSEIKHCAKFIKAAPTPVYGSRPQYSTFPDCSSGQWKIGSNATPKFGFYSLACVKPSFVLAIQSSRRGDARRHEAVVHALENYVTKIDSLVTIPTKTQTEVASTMPKVVPSNAVSVKSFPGSEKFRASDKINDPVLVILPNSNPTCFSNIKLWADCVQGIKTVCTIQSNGSQHLLFPEQLAMKINHHSGGVNYKIKGLDLDHKPCMVIGISFSHPSVRSNTVIDECPSLAAVVGSCDEYWLQYPRSMRVQTPNSEVSSLN